MTLASFAVVAVLFLRTALFHYARKSSDNQDIFLEIWQHEQRFCCMLQHATQGPGSGSGCSRRILRST